MSVLSNSSYILNVFVIGRFVFPHDIGRRQIHNQKFSGLLGKGIHWPHQCTIGCEFHDNHTVPLFVLTHRSCVNRSLRQRAGSTTPPGSGDRRHGIAHHPLPRCLSRYRISETNTEEVQCFPSGIIDPPKIPNALPIVRTGDRVQIIAPVRLAHSGILKFFIRPVNAVNACLQHLQAKKSTLQPRRTQ